MFYKDAYLVSMIAKKRSLLSNVICCVIPNHFLMLTLQKGTHHTVMAWHRKPRILGEHLELGSFHYHVCILTNKTTQLAVLGIKKLFKNHISPWTTFSPPFSASALLLFQYEFFTQKVFIFHIQNCMLLDSLQGHKNTFTRLTVSTKYGSDASALLLYLDVNLYNK